MKKAGKIAAITLGVIALLVILTDVALRSLLPLDSVRLYLLNKGKEYTNRELDADKVSASLMGLRLKNVQIASTEQGLKQGALLKADEVLVRFSLVHLLHGHLKVYAVRVKGLDVNIVRNLDGTFNFDGLIAAQEAPASPSAERTEAPYLTVKDVRLNGGHITFVDNAAGIRADVSDIYVSVDNLHLNRPFPLSANMTLTYEQPGLGRVELPVGVTVVTNLANLNLADASAQLKLLVLKHAGGVFIARGKVANFENPSVEMSVDGKMLNQKLLEPFMKDAPAFSVPQANVYLKSSVNVAGETAQINELRVEALDSKLQTKGSAGWKGEPTFSLNNAFTVRLAPLAGAVPLAAPYKPAGVVSGTADVTEKTVKAELQLLGVGATVPQAGRLSDFEASVCVKSIKELSVPSFAGKLNGEAFKGDLDVLQTKDAINVVLNGSANRVVLPPLPASEQNAPDPTLEQAATLAPAQPMDWPLPPLNVKADFWIGSMDAPFFYGTEMSFKADLAGVTPGLERAQGTLNLSMGNGEIKDLYKLTNANALTKVLFLSLGVVSKVINTLNVFAVLNGIGSGIVSAVTGGEEEQPVDMVVQTVTGPDGEPVQIMVPFTDRKIEGRMYYEKFATDVNFKDGVADIRKGTFVSDMISFRLDGTTNFKTQKIKMTVHAAPGKHYVDGVMPLTLSIGGTVAAPEGSMSMVGSLSSLLTQSVANNFASRSVKSGVGGIFGLFKKKDAASEKASVVTAADLAAAKEVPVQTPAASEGQSSAAPMPAGSEEQASSDPASAPGASAL